MPDLATFQNDFAKALMSDDQPDPAYRQLAFAVYRNTTARGAVEALRAAFPTVDMLVGEEMFTSVALDYRRERPPASPVLSDYGADFSAYLARQPWTCELPYLADVARLDRLWLESFLAADLSPGLTVSGEPAGQAAPGTSHSLSLRWSLCLFCNLFSSQSLVFAPIKPGGLRPRHWV